MLTPPRPISPKHGTADTQATFLQWRIHLHFVGTGKSLIDPQGFSIEPFIERHDLEDCATEYSQRIL
jgi:hypothetical protein